jgi:hypothetical protein
MFPWRSSAAEREVDYNNARIIVLRTGELSLPPELGNAVFVGFATDGTPWFIGDSDDPESTVFEDYVIRAKNKVLSIEHLNCHLDQSAFPGWWNYYPSICLLIAWEGYLSRGVPASASLMYFYGGVTLVWFLLSLALVFFNPAPDDPTYTIPVAARRRFRRALAAAAMIGLAASGHFAFGSDLPRVFDDKGAATAAAVSMSITVLASVQYFLRAHLWRVAWADEVGEVLWNYKKRRLQKHLVRVLEEMLERESLQRQQAQGSASAGPPPTSVPPAADIQPPNPSP